MIGWSVTSEVAHDRTRHDPAGILHLTPDPSASSQSEYARRLPGHDAVAAGLCRSQEIQGAIDDLDAPLIGAFLDSLEHQRKNGVRTRNARLAAIRSLFRYAALCHPDHAGLIQRVLAIPPKRFDRKLVTFLTEPEIGAFLAATDRSTWTGRRDHALFSLAAQTGLRASELIGLRCADLHLAAGAHVSCHGKGRKERITPLTSGLVTTLRLWLAERAGLPGETLFVTRSGTPLSRDALEHRLVKYVQIAGGSCPTLARKSVTMHVLRHSAAMRLLRAGIDTSVIALWLGHENVETTPVYLHADLAIKERALARTTPAESRPGRFRPTDKLLAFLEAL